MTEGCKECPYVTVCHQNLTPKRVYIITEVREKTVDCRVFGQKAQLVEVKMAEINAAIDPAYAVDKALIKFKPQLCSNIQCEKFQECVPDAVGEETYKIMRILDNLVCPATGKRLIRVSLLPFEVEESV